MRTSHLFFLAFIGTLTSACGTPVDADVDGKELADIETLDAGKSDSLSSTSTYYNVRQDFRRCIAPLCGGLFVSRVNRATTLCADGSYAPECYVAAENYDQLNFTSQQLADLTSAISRGQVVLRGSVKARSFGSFGNLGEFVASEAWQAPTAVATNDPVYRVTDSGITCFTYPCPSYHRAKLNSTVHANIAAVDLSQTGATQEQIGEAFQQMSEPHGTLVAGKTVTVSGPGGTAKGLTASQYYIRVLGHGCTSDADCPQLVCLPGGPCPHFVCDAATRQCVSQPACQPVLCALYCEYGFQTDANGCGICVCNDPPAKKCYIGGCSGQVCSDQQGVITTCEWREEYACYQTATCEVQADGNCGWTQTAALTLCLGR